MKELGGTVYELLAQIREDGAERFGIEFRVGPNERTVIYYDTAAGKVVLDRSESGQALALEFGRERSCTADLRDRMLTLQLFVDTSSVEVFVNDGETVFSARIFPEQVSTGIRLYTEGGSAEFRVVQWEIEYNGEE